MKTLLKFFLNQIAGFVNRLPIIEDIESETLRK